MSGKSAAVGVLTTGALLAAAASGPAGWAAIGLTGSSLAASAGLAAASLVEQRAQFKEQRGVRRRAESRQKRAEQAQVRALQESQFALAARRRERGASGFESTSVASRTLGQTGRGKTLLGS